MEVILIFFAAHWFLCLFTHSFFLHRYAAHRMFTMPKWVEKVFFVLTWAFQGTSYLSPAAYGAMHRIHHDKTDTAEDPHSPSYSTGIKDMMIKTKNVYLKFEEDLDAIPQKYAKNLPRWDAFDRFALSNFSKLLWIALYIAVYVIWAPDNYLWFLLLPAHIILSPIHGVIVNWFGHKIGYRNYNVKDLSRNMLPVDLIMWGESLHNNHHRFPARANFAVKWWEFDPMYPLIKLMHWTGVIKLQRVPA